jgi:hypothetical protein
MQETTGVRGFATDSEHTTVHPANQKIHRATQGKNLKQECRIKVFHSPTDAIFINLIKL